MSARSERGLACCAAFWVLIGCGSAGEDSSSTGETSPKGEPANQDGSSGVDDAESTSPAATLEEASESAGEDVSLLAQGRFDGFQLTDEEQQALHGALASNPQLSPPEVQALLGVEPTVLDADLPSGDAAAGLGKLESALRSGNDRSVGNCSTITLYGNDSGRYIFDQYMTSGTPLHGNVAIATNGIGSSIVSRDLSGGIHQRIDGTLSWVGFLPRATLMHGWMETTTGLVCFGSLTAEWF